MRAAMVISALVIAAGAAYATRYSTVGIVAGVITTDHWTGRVTMCTDEGCRLLPASVPTEPPLAAQLKAAVDKILTALAAEHSTDPLLNAIDRAHAADQLKAAVDHALGVTNP
jgi:hypothetical protein